MKNHSVPASADLTGTAGGIMKSRGFTWEKQCEKAYQHQLERAIHLARTNPDYQIKYPNECRENPERKLLKCCHPEAQKRILEKHEKILALAIVPIVDRPKRLNRSNG